MAWTTPKTWAADDLVTAALMNTHLKDNLNHLYNGREQCIVTKSTQSIPDGANTLLTFDTEVVDTAAMHSTGADTDRIICTVAGVYAVTAYSRFSADADGYRNIYIDHRDSSVALLGIPASNVCPGLAATTDLSTSGIVVMAVGDFVRVNIFQNSGASMNVVNNRFAVVRIG